MKGSVMFKKIIIGLLLLEVTLHAIEIYIDLGQVYG
tara:strand:+ start:163 stop:270 length:108 start_codon:yes stop_codon:yes gene_type:complete